MGCDSKKLKQAKLMNYKYDEAQAIDNLPNVVFA
jgi:hypothetical protein